MSRARRPSTGAVEAAPTALVVAASAPLTKGEQKLLAEAIRRGEEARDRVEDALVDYGRWLLVNIFDDDAAAALDRTDNRVWRALLDRAGGPALRAERRFVHVALSIAAHDKRIQDESWRLLDPGRKEVLLKLGDERAMREAAQHVVAMKLSNLKTRQYVRGLLAAEGKSAQLRITLPRVSANARKLRERFGAAGYRKAFERTLRDAEDGERATVRKELEALRATVEALLAIARR
jgi:hypothetical protein